MLFLGLGTELGPALVSEHVIVSQELGNLSSANGESLRRSIGTQRARGTRARGVARSRGGGSVDLLLQPQDGSRQVPTALCEANHRFASTPVDYFVLKNAVSCEPSRAVIVIR